MIRHHLVKQYFDGKEVYVTRHVFHSFKAAFRELVYSLQMDYMQSRESNTTYTIYDEYNGVIYTSENLRHYHLFSGSTVTEVDLNKPKSPHVVYERHYLNVPRPHGSSNKLPLNERN